MKKIILIGDETILKTHYMLASRFDGKAILWCPNEPSDCTHDVLSNLSDWVLKRQPDIVHISAGLKDVRSVCFGDEEPIVPIEFYRDNVRRILKLVSERTTASVVWGTITPVDERKLSAPDLHSPSCEYKNEVIAQYNDAARGIAAQFEIPVNDLYGTVKAASREASVRPDGIHLGADGVELIAEKIEGVFSSYLD